MQQPEQPATWLEHLPRLADDRNRQGLPTPMGDDQTDSPDPTQVDTARLRVLISAYGCAPTEGSEAGVGWNMACEMARYCTVWVVTRANNRPSVEAELAARPIPSLHFLYYDLPHWARWWKRGGRGVQLYYYLWQLAIYAHVRRLHRQVGFEIVHHVSFGKYWSPSLLALLDVPFVWGPVGGGESAPKAFWPDFGVRGFGFESVRESLRWLAEYDPLVRHTARRSSTSLAKTEETARRLRRLGCRTVQVCSEAGLTPTELDYLEAPPPPAQISCRFVGVGNLLHLKGFHLGLRAFAAAAIPSAEYWVIGDGPERRRLELLAERLGIAHQVVFWGRVSRREALSKLRECHVLVHPSLHDSGGWVCLEAMAARRPVLCLDLGGPATQVTAETGFKIMARTPEQVVSDLAEKMTRLALEPELRARMGQAARDRVISEYSWEKKGLLLKGIYGRLAARKT